MALAVIVGSLLPAAGPRAAEFYVGEPVEKEGLQIVPNYLVGIEMDKMPPGMEMGKDWSTSRRTSTRPRTRSTAFPRMRGCPT